MRTANCISPVCWLRMLVTWLLPAEIFSRDAFEKKEMLPFLVYTFCAVKQDAERINEINKRYFFIQVILWLNDTSFKVEIGLNAQFCICFPEAAADTF